MSADLHARVLAALDDVLDPCSIGRGIPSGMDEMGLVVACDVRAGGEVDLVLRLTAPACTFQLYFDQQVRARLAGVDGVGAVTIRWSDRFDWSDDDLAPSVRARLAAKHRRLLAGAAVPR